MHERMNIGTDPYVLPAPQTIVGSMLDGKPNFMALAWVSRFTHTPCLMGIGVNAKHATHRAILETGQFSINFPSVDMVNETDYVGLASGNRTDKSTVFKVHFGSLANAPLIEDCPISIELELFKHVDLETHSLFLGEVKGTWTEDRFMTDGYPDITKVRPLLLSMPDNIYWSVGEQKGKAWHDGKALRDTLKTKR
ncbi:flavin reductase family protein [Pseudodesulfovibrio piezophilus]|uniref:Flavin reductase domain protein FMN-binding n=1 Tax=Pseudodesulfovibrio piezophilus (strain DSM 21447 / JCM 15486 / C1TLV30) TaxID=1322246 RepID=M1WKM9_PSEP2|nr:flavin reductase family protein [Pseudodesulfovibrio piezophilus]CCH49881.1 Flavin reductase domain protein FMN-binding [Pseudodesulfovibrio piezophilus C1TLV30]